MRWHSFSRRTAACVFILFLSNYLILSDILELPLWTGIVFYCLAAPLYAWINIKPSRPTSFNRLTSMINGRELILLFSVTFTLNAILQFLFFRTVGSCLLFYGSLGLCLLIEFILALNGVVRLLLTSTQLGIKWRVLFAFLWWVPVVNLLLLIKMCRIVRLEYEFETEKRELDEVRRESEICRTAYPLLLVHGVFFRDIKHLNYWGRIPKELKRNGAQIYYGNQQSAACIKDSAAELKQRIENIVAETNCGRLNIIAHSKGGLDARYAISCLGMAPYVATLTTINTPHRGCAFADYLIEKLPKKATAFLARKYNSALKKLGDENPDFLGAVSDLTEKNCAVINSIAPNMDGVIYQSVTSKMNRWSSAPFPQNLTFLLVSHFNRKNDGLVAVEAAKWGSAFQLIEVPGKRGVSHGDIIDLYRENIRDFDVRELYITLMKDLKSRGY